MELRPGRRSVARSHMTTSLELTDLERVIKQNPFPEAETNPKALHVSFLVSAPTNPNLKALEGLKKESERFELIDSVFYLHAPEGVGR